MFYDLLYEKKETHSIPFLRGLKVNLKQYDSRFKVSILLFI